VITSWAI
jgi:hypothetical protein